MSLTRKMLKAMELDDDKISQIIDAHQATIDEIASERDSLKEELTKVKEDADKLKSVEKDLVKAQAKADEAEETAKKLKELQDEFKTYKDEVEAKTTKATQEKAYRELLKEAGVSDKRFDSIVKVSDVSEIKFDSDGKVIDKEKFLESIKSEWADFIQTTETKGAKTSTPPDNNGGNTFEKMTLAEKMAYANANPDSAEVQAWLK